MKRLVCLLVFSVWISISAVAQVYEKPGGGKGPITLDEIAKRQEISDRAMAVLDTFVGKYQGTVVRNGETQTVEWVVNPRFVQGCYFPGYTKVKNNQGQIVYEAATMLTYNIGGMAYLFFYFGSDNFIRTYVGGFSDDTILIRTPMPAGIEFLRFTKISASTLRQEVWKPVPNAGSHPAGDPDEVILFEKQ